MGYGLKGVADIILYDLETGMTILEAEAVRMEVNREEKNITVEVLDSWESMFTLTAYAEKDKTDKIEPCNLSDVNMSGFRDIHSGAYHTIGMYVDSLASMYPKTEPLTMKERKKNYNEGLKKLLNKGKNW